MSGSEIKDQFKAINYKLNLVRLLTVPLFIPVCVLYFSDLDAFIGLTKQSAVWVLLMGAAVNIGFHFKYWKCPSCGKKLGSGLSISQCQNCGVQLK